MWALLFILGILNVKQDQICSNCSPKVVALKLLEFISRAGLFSVETIKNPNFSSEITLKLIIIYWHSPIPDCILNKELCFQFLGLNFSKLRQKFSYQKLISVFGLATFLLFKLETAFRAKNSFRFQKVKNCHPPPLLW